MLFFECRKGGEPLTSSKMGRPTDNPKYTPLFVRLDQECREILTAYCEEKNVNKAEAARRGIKKLKDDLKK